MITPRLGYVQARVQARYAARPGPAAWASLAQVNEFGRYLQQADAAGFGRWTERLGVNSSAHHIEVSLREGFRQVVREIAAWMPAEWQDATLWFGLLIDLEAVRLIAGGEQPPAWIDADPFLSGLRLSGDRWPLAVLAQASADGAAIAENWRAHWFELAPDPADSGMTRLASVLPFARYTAEVAEKFERHFRHHSLRPGAVFGYLGLTLIDLLRLKGQLLRRSEFTAGGN